jgi:tRNA:m4X modification enzyme
MTDPSETLLPKPPNDWDRCHAYIERKRRFCKQKPSDGSADTPRFCGHHLHLLVSPETTVIRKRKRVPCPIDPSHSIYEDRVDNHALVCPKLTKQRTQQAMPFYKHNLNTGGHGTLGDQQKQPPFDLKKAKLVAKKVLFVHQMLFRGSCSENPADLLIDDINDALSVVDLSSPELEAGLPTAVTENRIKSGGSRHLQQQASIVGHLRRIGALETLAVAADEETMTSINRDTTLQRTVIELGAGRGVTGLVVAGVSAGAGVKTKLIMVERGGSRARADTVLRNAPKESKTTYPLDLLSIEWERIQCDIAHVDLSSVVMSKGEDSHDEEFSEKKKQKTSKPLVVVAKHLCGVGTDLALKSLEPLKDQLSACIFATCCHGVCSWSGFVGRDYLRAAMEKDDDFSFGEAEFELLRRWSSGSVLEQGSNTQPSSPSDDQQETNEHGSTSQCSVGNRGCDDETIISISKVVEALKLKCGVRGLGRACQRLIDYGRQEYLRNVLFAGDGQVEMLHYVSDKVTPQNAALVACRNQSLP